MFFYTKLGTYVVSFTISVILYTFILETESYIRERKIWEQAFSQLEKIEKQENKIKDSNINMENTVIDEIQKKTKLTDEWKIVIPSIGLEAPIEEGIDSQTMNRAVGHFPNTNRENGNIGLGAHNRGYAVNYFEKIKLLKLGDKVQYIYRGKEKNYIVDNIVIIKDTDWSYLETTEKNRITLITCVENEPEYRRCIQGSQID